MADTIENLPTGHSPATPAAATESRKRSREESKSNPQPPAPAPLPADGGSAGSRSNSHASQTFVDVDGTSGNSPAEPVPCKAPGSSGDSPPPVRSAVQSSSGAIVTSGTGKFGGHFGPGSDPRKMKQATLPMFGLMGDSASIKKELLDRDTHIDELKTRLQAVEEELVRRDTTVGFVESKLDLMAAKLSHFQAVMRREMVLASRKTRAEARRVLHQRHFELGQVAMWPNGREVWVEGNAVRELIPLEAETQARREEVEALKRSAHALVRQLTKQERDREDSAAGPPDAAVGGSGTDALVEAQKEYHLRSAELAAILGQISSFQKRREELEREKKAFMKEVRRISDEDASQFVAVDAIGPDSRYLLMSLLGKGGFSEVWRAFDLIDGQYVACKIHKIDRAWSQQVMDNYRRHAERELDIMRQLNHPNLTRQYNVFQLSDTMFVSVMEHCHGMDLDTYLKRYGSMGEKDAQLVVRQMVCGLLYLGNLDNPVIHYDLKPANILLQSDGTTIMEIKITDFGLSKIIGNTHDGPSDNPSIDLTSQGSGTYWYLPPECFDTSTTPRISNKVDVWALGVIFFQMLFGRRPFAEGESQRRIWQERLIVSAARSLTFPDTPRLSEDAKDFIRHCLTFNQADRYDISQASQHSYLGSLGRRAGTTRSRNPAGNN